MIFALVDHAGALLAWGATVDALPTPPQDSAVVALPSWDAPPIAPYAWSTTALNWVIPTPAVLRLTRLEFRWRYTLAEQVAIEMAEESDPDPTVRATLRVLRQSLAEATEIDVTDPRTQQGVQYHASLGLIAPTRVAEILAAP